jgi:hypothetical protein
VTYSCTKQCIAAPCLLQVSEGDLFIIKELGHGACGTVSHRLVTTSSSPLSLPPTSPGVCCGTRGQETSSWATQ